MQRWPRPSPPPRSRSRAQSLHGAAVDPVPDHRADREAFLATHGNRTRRKIGFAITVRVVPPRLRLQPRDRSREGSAPRRGQQAALVERDLVGAEAHRMGNRSGPDTLARDAPGGHDHIIAPSLSLSWAAFGLAGHPITVKGVPNTSNGKLPPHAVLGLKAFAEIAFDPPDSADDVVQLRLHSAVRGLQDHGEADLPGGDTHPGRDQEAGAIDEPAAPGAAQPAVDGNLLDRDASRSSRSRSPGRPLSAARPTAVCLDSTPCDPDS